MIRKRARDSSLFYINFFHWKGGIEILCNSGNANTCNEDGIDILVEDGEVENEYKND